MRDYAGRTAVVTGAGSGIGRALSLALAARGARLALSDVNGAAVLDTVQACERAGAQAKGWTLDVADREAVEAHAAEVVEAFDRVHLVVNNAGVALHGPVAELDLADMRWLMEVNYWGVVHGSQAFLPHLIASGDGQLANVSSIFGLIAVPGEAAYNAAKFAVRGFTEALRQEMIVERHPVSVSCIHPGGVKTAIAKAARYTPSVDGNGAAEFFDRVARTSPEGAARSIMRGLSRDKARILVGPDARVVAALPRVLGASYGGLVAGLARRYAP